jgi:hypothetical protein
VSKGASGPTRGRPSPKASSARPSGKWRCYPAAMDIYGWINQILDREGWGSQPTVGGSRSPRWPLPGGLRDDSWPARRLGRS